MESINSLIEGSLVEDFKFLSEDGAMLEPVEDDVFEFAMERVVGISLTNK